MTLTLNSLGRISAVRVSPHACSLTALFLFLLVSGSARGATELQPSSVFVVMTAGGEGPFDSPINETLIGQPGSFQLESSGIAGNVISDPPRTIEHAFNGIVTVSNELIGASIEGEVLFNGRRGVSPGLLFSSNFFVVDEPAYFFLGFEAAVESSSVGLLGGERPMTGQAIVNFGNNLGTLHEIELTEVGLSANGFRLDEPIVNEEPSPVVARTHGSLNPGFYTMNINGAIGGTTIEGPFPDSAFPLHASLSLHTELRLTTRRILSSSGADLQFNDSDNWENGIVPGAKDTAFAEVDENTTLIFPPGVTQLGGMVFRIFPLASGEDPPELEIKIPEGSTVQIPNVVLGNDTGGSLTGTTTLKVGANADMDGLNALLAPNSRFEVQGNATGEYHYDTTPCNAPDCNPTPTIVIDGNGNIQILLPDVQEGENCACAEGAVAAGRGSFEFHPIVAIRPGVSDQPIGRLSFDDTLVVNVDTVIQFQLGGANPNEHDQILVGNRAELSGFVSIESLDEFDPEPGTTFDLLIADHLVVDAETLASPGLPKDISGRLETIEIAEGEYSGNYALRFIVGGDLLEGDYNGDSTVEQGDLDLVLLNWGDELLDSAAAGWINDLPNGVIDQEELDKVLLSWGSRADQSGAALVPEPSNAMLAITTLLVLLLYAALSLSRCRHTSLII